jgi:hypothetical protein
MGGVALGPILVNYATEGPISFTLESVNAWARKSSSTETMA